MGLTIRRNKGVAPEGEALSPEAEEGYTRFRGLQRPAPACYAPDVALNFFVDGSVASCCLGRSFPVGRFPDQSIQEIWEGAATRTMQESLRARRLPASCEVCRDQIEAGNYAGVMAGVYEHLADEATAAAGRPILRSVEFEISNACNLECVMCNGWNSSLIRRNREHLPPVPERYGPAFLEQLRPFMPELRTAKFLGGEPFLIPAYLDIWDALAELNPDAAVSITTNGTVMNRRVRSVLDRLAPTIVISLDSVDRAVYEAVRVNGRLDDVLANVEIFREAGVANGSPVTISACPMVETWRTLPELVDYANQRSLPVFFNTVLSPVASSLRSLGPVGLHQVATQLTDEADRLEASAADPVAVLNIERLRGVARQAELWSEKPIAGPARSVDAVLAAELQAWSGHEAIHVLLEEHLALSIHVPPWAERLTPTDWIGVKEDELLPSLIAAVGAGGADAEIVERDEGVVQADLVFDGGANGRMRVLRLPPPERDPSRWAMLIAYRAPDD